MMYTDDSEPVPTEIRLDQARRLLTVSFDDGGHFAMTAEYLRVHSPSAEVRGHSRGEGILQVGKADVAIREISPIGNYAVRLIFDDGHSTGLYTWKLLYELGRDRDENWRSYQERVAEAGGAAAAPVRSGGACAGALRPPRS